MKNARRIILFIAVITALLVIPISAQAKSSGYLKLSSDKTRMEYHYSNGKLAKKATVKHGKKTIVTNKKGYVRFINGKKQGKLKAKNGKTYFIVNAKTYTGVYNKKLFINGLFKSNFSGVKNLNGVNYYFINGIVAGPTKDNPLKILLVGNSYTYYNGYPEMLSKMIALTGKYAIVVRATKGGVAINSLMTQTLSYNAWRDGQSIASESGKTLEEIMNIDFGGLGRAGQWDYIIAQNNDDSSDNCTINDVNFVNYVRPRVASSDRIMIHGMYYAGSLDNKRFGYHYNAAVMTQSSLINSLSFYTDYNAAFNSSWYTDLTLTDSNAHPSGRGGYLLALCIYAKIFGTNSFAISELDPNFIPLFNSDGGVTKEFASDKYNAKKAPNYAMSVTLVEAKRLQGFVKARADMYLGTPLFLTHYGYL